MDLRLRSRYLAAQRGRGRPGAGMTALKQYARLESIGVWRDGPEARRRDVFVSFGDSSLVISDKADMPITHWSLAAVRRVNAGERPAVFSPGADATETLEVLWLPGALLRHTVSVLPPATRDAIGGALLAQITRISGPPCAAERGPEALALLEARLLGPGGGRILILPAGVRTTVHLPGGRILVGRDLVEDHETPDVVAGYVLAETLRREAEDPMARLLRAAGTMATFRLLTTGEFPEGRLAAYAEALLTAEPDPVSDEALLARFAAAKVPASSSAYAVDITGENTLGLIEADPMWENGATPVLADADWVGLQGICGE